jgi:hypothetical protein
MMRFPDVNIGLTAFQVSKNSPAVIDVVRQQAAGSYLDVVAALRGRQQVKAEGVVGPRASAAGRAGISGTAYETPKFSASQATPFGGAPPIGSQAGAFCEVRVR